MWNAATTTGKDRKQLLRTLLDEVAITVHRDQTEGRAELLRWKGGAISELTVPLKRQPPKNRTPEDTVELVRRLAVHYADGMIAAMLNKQGRTTATGMSFTPGRVQSLRHHWEIGGEVAWSAAAPCRSSVLDTATCDPVTWRGWRVGQVPGSGGKAAGVARAVS